MLASKQVASILVNSGCYISLWDRPDKWVRMPDDSMIPAYLSCRRLISNVASRKAIEALMANYVKEHFPEVDLIAGLSTAGISWAHAVADKLDLPLCYVRSSVKGYGENKRVEGAPAHSIKALIIDDTFFTGEAITQARESLSSELDIQAVGALTVASLSPASTLGNDPNFKVASLTNYTDICEAALESGLLNQFQVTEMLNYYASPSGYQFKIA